MTTPGERRAAKVELRAAGRKLEGYAAVFSTETRIGRTIETIAPQAFAASLNSGRDVLALVDHDPGRLLARTKSGTLRLATDAKGLAFSIDVPDTQLGNDTLALAERGDLGGASFAFTIPPGGERSDGSRRELLSVILHEISIVSAWPAYSDTSVQARSQTPRLSLRRRFLETIR